jgi:alcohol-forming fatty acyl-CoA reductase
VPLEHRLAGRRVLLTGVTGFLGEALLQRLLVDLPATRIVALVRPRGGQSGRDRLVQLLSKPAFAAPAEDEGGLEVRATRLLDSRIEVLEGDLNAPPALPSDVDIVIHCAGDVSFDAPIADAFRTNVLGTRALLERVVEASSRSSAQVHYVHVSTAYVAGQRRGPALESRVEHEVDWRAESEAGMRMAERIEETSRTPGVLRRLHEEAARGHGRAGPLATAVETERRRVQWVEEQQVSAGRERARSLGWPDVYTFTKALGERVVEEFGAGTSGIGNAADTASIGPGIGLRVSVVRPTIIESALCWPYPGWIEGYKMAEPIILAYGRGELSQFPGAADTIVDIVPVDHVVNALLAVAAGAPPLGTLAYFHVCSGNRNPLTFHRLYELVRAYFEEHPFRPGNRGTVRLPTWTFPGLRKVETALVRSERAYRLANRAVELAPRSDGVRKLARELDTAKRRLDFLRRHSDLYHSYSQAELHFVDDATLALHQAMDPADAASFAFDTAEIDWEHYIRGVHCPSITAPIRDYDVVRRNSRPAGPPRPHALRPPPEGSLVLAAFDMDGTLLASNVLETYLWLRLPELSPAGRVREAAAMLRRLPAYIAAERRDRGDFLRAAYRQYAGAHLAALEDLVDEAVAPRVLDGVSGAALRRVREHRAAGHRTLLITGAIQPLTRPLAPLFDLVVAAKLAVDGRGRCTGHLDFPPLVGESRAAWLRRYAQVEDVDLSRCYAYADSQSDLPLLEAVGLPTAVNPDVALWRRARLKRWPIEDWTSERTARLAPYSRARDWVGNGGVGASG